MNNFEDIKNNDIKEMLKTLTKEYGFTFETLSKLLNVDIPLLKDNKLISCKSDDFKKEFLIITKLQMLSLIANEEPDFKFRAFLLVLIDYHNISIHTIAKLAHIKDDEVTSFLNNDNTLSYEKKYALASVIMSLRFIFKDLEQEL